MEWLTRHLDFVLLHFGSHAVTTRAVATLTATVALAFVASVLTQRAVQSVLLRNANGRSAGLAYSIARIAQYAVVIVVSLVGLDNAGVSLTALTTVGAVLSVGIGFGLQNIAQNFISGLILLLERPIQQGDFIQVGETVGRVEEIAMRATRVISRDGVAVIVPNSLLITATVINQSAGAHNYRARIKLGVAYGTDLAHLQRVLNTTALAHADVLRDPAPSLFFRNFGASTLDFELAVWLADPQREPIVTSDLRFAIDAAFREHELEMPSPQYGVVLRDARATPSQTPVG
jgi:potassium efflux system protein